MTGMLEALTKTVGTILKNSGFRVLKSVSEPKHFGLKGEYIAFVSPSSIRYTGSCFELSDCNRQRVLEYTLSCLLLGCEGDCSDRDKLLSLAENAYNALLSAGYDAELCSDNEIDGKLSRAACVIKLRDGIMLPADEEEI